MAAREDMRHAVERPAKACYNRVVNRENMCVLNPVTKIMNGNVQDAFPGSGKAFF
jgi:hypothetical protein